MADRVIIFQVAEEAGASAKTVSTVIHGKPGASEEIGATFRRRPSGWGTGRQGLVILGPPFGDGFLRAR